MRLEHADALTLTEMTETPEKVSITAFQITCTMLIYLVFMVIHITVLTLFISDQAM
jgi:hypothetical protein